MYVCMYVCMCNEMYECMNQIRQVHNKQCNIYTHHTHTHCTVKVIFTYCLNNQCRISRKHEQHLLLATLEVVLSSGCDKSKKTVCETYSLHGHFNPSSPLLPHSLEFLPSVIHYLFDMAQQVHYPSDPLQSCG